MTGPETPGKEPVPPDVVGELWERMFAELHAAAHAQMARVGPGGTMSTGALVNEAYLKIRRSGRVEWNDVPHFVAFAASAMRSIILDYLRQHAARPAAVTLDSGHSPLVSTGEPLDLIALDDALQRLGVAEPRQAQVVEMRFFGGFSTEEVAAELGVSPNTVKNDWNAAKRWLKHELGGEPAR